MGLKEYNSVQLIEENLISFRECIELIAQHEEIDKETAFDWLRSRDFLFGFDCVFYKLNNIDNKVDISFSNYHLTHFQNEFDYLNKYYTDIDSNLYAFPRFGFYYYLSMEMELTAKTRYLIFNLYHDLVDPKWLETRHLKFYKFEFKSAHYCRFNFKDYIFPDEIREDELTCLCFGVKPTRAFFYLLKSEMLWVKKAEFERVFNLIGLNHYGIKYSDYEIECKIQEDVCDFRDVGFESSVRMLIRNVTDWSFPDLFYEIASTEKTTKTHYLESCINKNIDWDKWRLIPVLNLMECSMLSLNFHPSESVYTQILSQEDTIDGGQLQDRIEIITRNIESFGHIESSYTGTYYIQTNTREDEKHDFFNINLIKFSAWAIKNNLKIPEEMKNFSNKENDNLNSINLQYSTEEMINDYSKNPFYSFDEMVDFDLKYVSNQSSTDFLVKLIQILQNRNKELVKESTELKKQNEIKQSKSNNDLSKGGYKLIGVLLQYLIDRPFTSNNINQQSIKAQILEHYPHVQGLGQRTIEDLFAKANQIFSELPTKVEK